MAGGDALAALVGAELSRPAPRVGAGLRRRAAPPPRRLARRGALLRLVPAPRQRRGRARLLRARRRLPRRLRVARARLRQRRAAAERLLPGARARGHAAARQVRRVLAARLRARGAALARCRTGTWARFCQPALAVYTRDAAARDALVAALCAAVETRSAARPGAPAGRGRRARALRPSRSGSASSARPTPRSCDRRATRAPRAIYAADPPRYARALDGALEALASRSASAHPASGRPTPGGWSARPARCAPRAVALRCAVRSRRPPRPRSS